MRECVNLSCGCSSVAVDEGEARLNRLASEGIATWGKVLARLFRNDPLYDNARDYQDRHRAHVRLHGVSQKPWRFVLPSFL